MPAPAGASDVVVIVKPWSGAKKRIRRANKGSL